MTLPFWSKRDPWLGQSSVPSVALKWTAEPRCVQAMEAAPKPLPVVQTRTRSGEPATLTLIWSPGFRSRPVMGTTPWGFISTRGTGFTAAQPAAFIARAHPAQPARNSRRLRSIGSPVQQQHFRREPGAQRDHEAAVAFAGIAAGNDVGQGEEDGGAGQIPDVRQAGLRPAEVLLAEREHV